MIDSELQIQETGEGLELRLHVQPRARRSEIAGVHAGALKVKITAPPVDDAANRAIIQYFSTLLGIPRSSIQIMSGLKSRDKRIQIRGLSLPNFLHRLKTGS
jgi:uncharacterized protein (TIGR00251 family)